MQLRALTSELGCISVSACFAAPQVQNSLDVGVFVNCWVHTRCTDGNPVAPNGALLQGQATALFKQLDWMGTAMKNHREKFPSF